MGHKYFFLNLDIKRTYWQTSMMRTIRMQEFLLRLSEWFGVFKNKTAMELQEFNLLKAKHMQQLETVKGLLARGAADSSLKKRLRESMSGND